LKPWYSAPEQESQLPFLLLYFLLVPEGIYTERVFMGVDNEHLYSFPKGHVIMLT